MKRIAIVGALLAGVAGLSACTTADGAISQVTQSERLDNICQLSPPIHFAFLAIAETTDIDQAYVEREQQAYQVLVTICRNRPANVGEALETALEAYTTILTANEEVAKVE